MVKLRENLQQYSGLARQNDPSQNDPRVILSQDRMTPRYNYVTLRYAMDKICIALHYIYYNTLH